MSHHKTVADVADNVVNQLSGAVQAMADAFKKVAPHVWEVMVRQQILEGVTGLALFVGIVALFIFSCVFVKKLRTKYEAFWSSEKDFPTPALFALSIPFVLAICIINTAGKVPEHVTKIINPEYYAAYELLDTIKE